MDTVITIGTFDGVHRGHKMVLETLKKTASENGLKPLVITFDRHPLEIVAPERAPQLLMAIEERDKILRENQVEVDRIPFSEELRHQTAAEWMKVLRDKYHARFVVLGYDNTFGSDGRSLGFGDYKRIGCALGINVLMAPEINGCSSSAVRHYVREGDVVRAAEILGRPFAVNGKVISGRQIGRTIGIPTANLKVSSRQLLPKPGVYQAKVFAEGNHYDAIVNVGINPTVSDSGHLKIEAHLLGYTGNLYGKTIKIEFIKRIRDERKFDSIEDLKSQINKDIQSIS